MGLADYRTIAVWAVHSHLARSVDVGHQRYVPSQVLLVRSGSRSHGAKVSADLTPDCAPLLWIFQTSTR
jgi:hypothetical protein